MAVCLTHAGYIVPDIVVKIPFGDTISKFSMAFLFSRGVSGCVDTDLIVVGHSIQGFDEIRRPLQ